MSDILWKTNEIILYFVIIYTLSFVYITCVGVDKDIKEASKILAVIGQLRAIDACMWS